ncbi:hypothetical protein ACP4OV_013674 [Aristida adscensionis]
MPAGQPHAHKPDGGGVNNSNRRRPARRRRTRPWSRRTTESWVWAQIKAEARHYDLFLASLTDHTSLRATVVADLLAALSRDPACVGFSHCLLNYKSFLAIEAHRVAHVL